MDKTEYFKMNNSSYGEEDIIFDLSEDTQSTKWAVPWSDLTFILLITVLAYSINLFAKKNPKIDGKKTKVESSTKITPILKEKTGVIEDNQLFTLTKNIISEFENVTVEYQSDHSIKVSLRGPLFFETGNANLKKDAIEFLKEISTVIKESNNKVQIIGHTDSVPIHTDEFETNWELSTIRAVNVARYLIEKQKVEPERFTVSGESMYHPVAPNTIADFKAQNRRVEIIIKKEPFI